MDRMDKVWHISYSGRTLLMYGLILDSSENEGPVTTYIHLDKSQNILLGKIPNQRKSMIPFKKDTTLNNIRKSKRMIN